MQLNNYLIALALTMSICILALTMRSSETITMLQPVMPDEARQIHNFSLCFLILSCAKFNCENYLSIEWNIIFESNLIHRIEC
jgi:hypothetical protein